MRHNRTHLLTNPAMFKTLENYGWQTFRLYKARFKRLTDQVPSAQTARAQTR